MSKIKFEQIHDDVVEVRIPEETPMDMVQQLCKSLVSRGLVEDTSNSTLSVRYFYRPTDKANVLADELIKSLKGLAKDDADAYWKPKNQMAHQKKMREQAIAERRAKIGVGKPNVSTNPSKPNQMYDYDAKNSWTAEGTGKRYAFIRDVNKMEEHPGDCDCGHCEPMDKSGYGPKGMSQYSVADNIRRKARNTGDQSGFGSNVNTKRYTSATYGNMTPQTSPNLKRPQPVKQWTPEQIAAENAKRGLKKAWVQHNSIPSAEEEIMKLAGVPAETGEQAAANQLANLMAGKKMLGGHPMVRAMMQEPPPQPTNEQLFGHLVPSEEMVKSAEDNWQNGLNNFFAEASKPISARFASEEEEIAYWNSIKVADRDDGKSGY
jgi:hypothetical protein